MHLCRGGEGQSGRKTESQADSVPSVEPNSGPDPMTLRSRPVTPRAKTRSQTPNCLHHPGAPEATFLIKANMIWHKRRILRTQGKVKSQFGSGHTVSQDWNSDVKSLCFRHSGPLIKYPQGPEEARNPFFGVINLRFCCQLIQKNFKMSHRCGFDSNPPSASRCRDKYLLLFVHTHTLPAPPLQGLGHAEVGARCSQPWPSSLRDLRRVAVLSEPEPA